MFKDALKWRNMLMLNRLRRKQKFKDALWKALQEPVVGEPEVEEAEVEEAAEDNKENLENQENVRKRRKFTRVPKAAPVVPKAPVVPEVAVAKPKAAPKKQSRKQQIETLTQEAEEQAPDTLEQQGYIKLRIQ